jgi:diguanylate cyclase (GGDEF)-like protein
MPLTYEIDSKLKQLVPVMDEHAEWYGRVMRAAFYPEAAQGGIHSPEQFKTWLRTVEGEDFLDTHALARLKALHDELHAKGTELVVAAAEGRKPSVKLFDNFTDLYDDFVMLLRRFERDCVMEDSGIDAATGLRSRRVMRKDLEREMERRSRRGKPFSLALVKMDRYEEIRALQSDDDHTRLMHKMADMIRKCLRSFDDAYRSGEGEFIMSLKHADISGGTAALNRLRRILEEEEVRFRTASGMFSLSLSCVVAEPLPGDDLSILLDNMRQDLGRYDRDTGTALEYHEISPLQRFVETIGGEDSSKG